MLHSERIRMIAAGKTPTRHIALACSSLKPNELEDEIEALIFDFHEDSCDERASIDFSIIPTTHREALYRALEKADENQGIGFGFPRLRGYEEHEDQIVPMNGCALLQLASRLLSIIPAEAFSMENIDIKFSIDLGL